MKIEYEKIRMRLEEIRNKIRTVEAGELETFIVSAMMGFIRDYSILSKKFDENKNEDAFLRISQFVESKKQNKTAPHTTSGPVPEAFLADLIFYQKIREGELRDDAAFVCNNLLNFLEQQDKPAKSSDKNISDLETIPYKDFSTEVDSETVFRLLSSDGKKRSNFNSDSKIKDLWSLLLRNVGKSISIEKAMEDCCIADYLQFQKDINNLVQKILEVSSFDKDEVRSWFVKSKNHIFLKS